MILIVVIISLLLFSIDCVKIIFKYFQLLIRFFAKKYSLYTALKDMSLSGYIYFNKVLYFAQYNYIFRLNCIIFHKAAYAGRRPARRKGGESERSTSLRAMRPHKKGDQASAHAHSPSKRKTGERTFLPRHDMIAGRGRQGPPAQGNTPLALIDG